MFSCKVNYLWQWTLQTEFVQAHSGSNNPSYLISKHQGLTLKTNVSLSNKFSCSILVQSSTLGLKPRVSTIDQNKQKAGSGSIQRRCLGSFGETGFEQGEEIKIPHHYSHKQLRFCGDPAFLLVLLLVPPNDLRLVVLILTQFPLNLVIAYWMAIKEILTHWWFFQVQSMDELMNSSCAATASKDDGIAFTCIHSISDYVPKKKK